MGQDFLDIHYYLYVLPTLASLLRILHPLCLLSFVSFTNTASHCIFQKFSLQFDYHSICDLALQGEIASFANSVWKILISFGNFAPLGNYRLVGFQCNFVKTNLVSNTRIWIQNSLTSLAIELFHYCLSKKPWPNQFSNSLYRRVKASWIYSIY